MAALYDKDAQKAKEMYGRLSRKKKVAHFWEYYKTVFFTVIVLLMVVGIVYVMKQKPQPEANLRIKFVNVSMEGLKEENNKIEADYEAYLGADNTCRMLFHYSELNPNDEIQAGDTMENMMVEVVTCNLELFVFDEYAMDKLCPTGFVLDLNTCLDSEMLVQMQDKLIYYKDLEGNTVPMAIDITNTDYVKDKGIEGDGIYIAFVANSPNAETAKQFVTYVLSTK